MRSALLLTVLVLFATGCDSMRIAVNEQLGYAKREQLVDRVESARDGQAEAKEQFGSALEEFLAVTEADPGELEEVYERLRDELDDCESRADAVRGRVDAVERVADALFDEWQDELEDYGSAELRRTSENQLERTRASATSLIEAMRKAEATMDPVLVAFRDQVLFLKHNLNARAIAALESTAASLEAEISQLVAEMEASIAEADAFIQAMSDGDAGP